MTKGTSCLDCLWQKIDLALKKEAEYYEDTFTDDDSSVYTDDDVDSDSEGEVDNGQSEQETFRLQLHSNLSDTNLFKVVEGRGEVFQNIMKRLDSAEASSKIDVAAHATDKAANVDDDLNPQSPRDYLENTLKSMGGTAKVRSYKSMKEFFLQHTKEQVAAYDNTVIGAVRRNDVEELRRLHRNGRDLQCCNHFGESIIHTIARRGSPEMLTFLLTETQCSLRVCCDNGRNPLHDACWTSSPNFDVVRLILRNTPDFLLISDSRNFTPLDYVPRDSWALWCNFIDENKALLKPVV